MSLHKFGYSAKSLQKDKIENLEKDFDSQSKLNNIKLNDMQSTISGMSDKLETYTAKLASYIIESKEQNTELLTELRVEEFQFINDETQIVVNAKLFLDMNKSIEDIKINLKYLEQDIKNKSLEKKKEIISEAVKQTNEQQVILRNHFARNLISELEKSKNQAVKDTIQLLYNKGLFDSFENKDQIFIEYLYFDKEYLLEKYGKEIKTSDGVYYLSELDYSTREDIVKCLKKDEYKDIVDLKYRMKLRILILILKRDYFLKSEYFIKLGFYLKLNE